MTLLQGFLNDNLDPNGFDHRAHVEVAFEILRHHPLAEATQIYTRHLKALTLRAGAPEKFNAALTRHAMDIISSRMQPSESFDDFLNRNPETLRSETFRT